MLNLLTGDAIYLQRPLLKVLREHGVDYLLQVKDNQSDTVGALEVCFAEEHLDEPVETVKKKRPYCYSAIMVEHQRCSISSHTIRVVGLSSCDLS
jgi:hypothetical protein